MTVAPILRTIVANPKWQFCLAVSLMAIAAACWPEALMQWRYDRTAVLSGQWWRLATGHAVHLNATHLLLNLAGLLLLCEILWLDTPRRDAAGALAASMLAVSGLLWWLQPGVEWYAGLSGALHGLWSCLAVSAASQSTDGTSRRIGAAALLLLAGKLVSELVLGVHPATVDAIGGPVVAVSHAYGAVGGMAYAYGRRLFDAWHSRTDFARVLD